MAAPHGPKVRRTPGLPVDIRAAKCHPESLDDRSRGIAFHQEWPWGPVPQTPFLLRLDPFGRFRMFRNQSPCTPYVLLSAVLTLPLGLGCSGTDKAESKESGTQPAASSTISLTPSLPDGDNIPAVTGPDAPAIPTIAPRTYVPYVPDGPTPSQLNAQVPKTTAAPAPKVPNVYKPVDDVPAPPTSAAERAAPMSSAKPSKK
jgi:hypothetical protein